MVGLVGFCPHIFGWIRFQKMDSCPVLVASASGGVNWPVDVAGRELCLGLCRRRGWLVAG